MTTHIITQVEPQPVFIEMSSRWDWSANGQHFTTASRPWWSYAIDAGASPDGAISAVRVNLDPTRTIDPDDPDKWYWVISEELLPEWWNSGNKIIYRGAA